MDSIKIPVTLDFFKKYTYHEEVVDIMFKAKAKGNQQIYDALRNSPESKERALELYYEAFYLKPEIRKKYPIRLKAAPKKIKDKLLAIPEQDDSRHANDSPTQELLIGELEKDAKSNTDGFVNNEANANKKDLQRKRLIIEAAESAEQEVEDDSQPISSPEKIDSTRELNENVIIVEAIQDNNTTPVEIIIRETIEKEIQKPAITTVVAQKPKEVPAIGSSQNVEDNSDKLGVQQINSKVTSTLSPKKSPVTNSDTKAVMSLESNNNLQQNRKESIDHDANSEPQIQTQAANQNTFDYKSLVPYLHCCPITYKEFRKYSNINELVKEFCKKKQLNSREERVILNRSYILFYLAPEHRNITPLNKIQLAKNCPKHISHKFFNIPTKLYLKEQENVVEKEPPSTATKDLNSSGKIALDQAQNVTETITQQNIVQNTNNCEALAFTQTQNAGGNDQISCQATTNNETIPVNQTQNMPIPAANQKSITNNNTEVLSLAQEIRTTSSIDQSKSMSPQHMTNNEEICLPQPQITACNTNDNENLPVTLEEFKQYTFYEHVIDNLFKSVASGHENIYLKYKNSQEACNATLMNYYRAFYLIPVVRDKFPIQFKYTTKQLKSRLLQIPHGINVNDFADIRADQLVFPELKDFVEIKEEPNDANVVVVDRQLEERQETAMIVDNCPVANNQLAVGENAMKCVDSVSGTVLSLRTCTGVEENASNSPESSKQCIARFLQNNNKTTASLKGIKRSPKTDDEEPSYKRSKRQQTPDIPQNTTKTKKNYKELLCYAHCCPVTFSQFKKYTNISELFTAFCLNEYKDLKKLPFILHKAYILHYLASENRKFNPLNKLKLTADCPQHLKEKMFEIPEYLYVQPQKNVNSLLVLKQEINKEHTRQRQQTITNNCRTFIEILENRLLPPITLNLAHHSAITESITPLNCSNTHCVFYYISHHDFMQQTNILQFLPLPHDMNMVKNIFKIFMYKIIKGSYCDELYIHAVLVSKLLKHQHICEYCELDINTAIVTMESQQQRASQICNENVIEKDRKVSKRSTINDKKNLITNTQVQGAISENITKTLAHGSIKCLQKNKNFQKFRRKILAKLNQNFDNGMDFTSDTYKIFLQCNEIPLRQILNLFCNKMDDIVERILKDEELCDALNYYYYWKYLTNSNFASKYPVKIRNSQELTNLSKENNTQVAKQSEETIAIKESQNVEGKSKESEDGKELQPNVNTKTVAEKQIEITNQNNKALEKAKRIFFRNVERINTLSYVVRTSFGLKQLILRSILTLSYEEFLQLTNIYEGQSLYEDSHIAECMYRYVFHTPNVWPTNLFITLQNLCNFLQKKNIHFNKHTTMLADVSPKLLHWSDLRTCTNIEDSVSIDYEKRTGKKLNFNDATVVNNEFNEYYNRCWKQEKWLGQLPLINIEFYTNHFSNSESADVTMFDECATEEPVQTTTDVCSIQECPLQENAEEPVQSITNFCPSQEPTLQKTTEGSVQSTTNVCPSQECASQEALTLQQEHIEQSEAVTQNVNSPEAIVSDCVSEVFIETNNAGNIPSNANQSLKEFNCVLLPNTQQQINMLPAEVGVTNDPLDNCTMNIHALNVSASSSNNCEVITPDEQSPCIKTEPIDIKILNNLLFYEDDESNMQCVACEEEIVNLDDTVSPNYSDLLPSQLEFDDVVPQQILSDNLPTSDSSNSDINLAQRLPSSIESNTTTLCSQQFMQLQNMPAMTSTQVIQLADVSLRSSGENISQQQQTQKQNVENGNENGQYSQEVGKLEQLVNSLQELEDTSGSETASTQKEAPELPNSLESNSDSFEMVQQQQDNMQKNSALTDEVKRIYRAVLPLRQSTMTIAKPKKNVAKVRPLKNFDFVPQIEHIMRPLPLYTLRGAKTVNDLNQQNRDLIAANSTTTIPLAVATTQSSIVLRISQELNTNCSVFDNSSLLRLVDHNYHHSPHTITQSPSTSEQAKADLLQQTTSSAGNQQTQSQLESNSQSSNIKSARKLSIVAETDITASPRPITRSSTSVGINNNNKRNNVRKKKS